MLTEQQNPRTVQLDSASTLEILQIINGEDATVAAAVERALPDIAQAVDAIVACLEGGGRLIYVGAGTSGRLGVLDAAESIPTFGTPPELVRALIAGGQAALTRPIEGAEDDIQAGRDDLLAIGLTSADAIVGIAASGRTPYVLSAVAAANEHQAVTIGISCNIPAPLLEAAHIKIGLPVGAEVVTGSTRMKAGTAQKMVLNMLSTAAMVRLGKVYGNLMVDMQATNQKLADRARRIVSLVTGVGDTGAEHLLIQADHDVKTAIVMQRRGVPPGEARRLLATAKGRLREVIG